jgi:co-chaperonin GroES (HSP10)
MSRDTENEARKRLDDLAALNPEELHRFRPMSDKVLIRRRPRKAMHGLLHIPRAYQDHPLDGIVVAVGPGRPFKPRYCTAADTAEECGKPAGFVTESPKDGKTVYLCGDHASDFERRYVIAPRRLLTHRPVGVVVGDRVAFSGYAEGHHVRIIGREEYILTDDVTMVLGPDVGIVERCT